MKLFFYYLKTRIKLIAVFCLFSVVFLISFLLYHLPVAGVIYPAILCAFFGIAFLIADFFKVRKKHDELEKIRKLTSAMIENLPEAGSIAEDDYRKIIKSLKSENIMIQGNDMAKYNDMTDYYTAWAHQIKTPIAAMKLTLQQEDSSFSRKLMSDLFRIEQYVEMVLAFLRLDSETSDYVFKEYNIDDIIRSSVKKFASQFIDKKLSLLYEPINKSVITDEKWLSFVIEQILSNSLKYTNEGSIRIYMKEPEILCISDTGIGIEKEDLPRIFEKGYTGYNGRIDKTASGIGLYLCKRVCDNLEIKISAQSDIGNGTTIMLDLSQYDLKTE